MENHDLIEKLENSTTPLLIFPKAIQKKKDSGSEYIMMVDSESLVKKFIGSVSSSGRVQWDNNFEAENYSGPYYLSKKNIGSNLNVISNAVYWKRVTTKYKSLDQYDSFYLNITRDISKSINSFKLSGNNYSHISVDRELNSIKHRGVNLNYKYDKKSRTVNLKNFIPEKYGWKFLGYGTGKKSTFTYRGTPPKFIASKSKTYTGQLDKNKLMNISPTPRYGEKLYYRLEPFTLELKKAKIDPGTRIFVDPEVPTRIVHLDQMSKSQYFNESIFIKGKLSSGAIIHTSEKLFISRNQFEASSGGLFGKEIFNADKHLNADSIVYKENHLIGVAWKLKMFPAILY